VYVMLRTIVECAGVYWITRTLTVSQPCGHRWQRLTCAGRVCVWGCECDAEVLAELRSDANLATLLREAQI
jgi:hypothetical protein